MEEPRLFELKGYVEGAAFSCVRDPDGWVLTMSYRRESDPLKWIREEYRALTTSELADIVVATLLS